MKIGIILGAGASAAEGAPLQNTLFRDYFKSVRGRGGSRTKMNKELARFFERMFAIDVFHGDIDNTVFPTFEETLGILDLAERRRESLRGFELENIISKRNRIRFIRQYLVLLMAKIIHDRLFQSNGHHSRLVRNLRAGRQLKDTIFVSTNYDIVIDNALTLLGPPGSLDYGVEFTNFSLELDWKRPTKSAVMLYKVHGSLNWLYCPTCDSLTLTPLAKGVIRLLTDFSMSKCPRCKTVIIPIIVPPTFFKDMSNIFLSQVWHKAEHDLSSVDHIVFCGYSFPDADMHIKYLLKRVQTKRVAPLSFTVFNHHEGKKPEIALEEELRYKRFLGSRVNYTDRSFEDFCNQPMAYLQSNRQ